jgi:hypothetical protein
MKKRFYYFTSLLAEVVLAIVCLCLAPFVWVFEYANQLLGGIAREVNEAAKEDGRK